MSECAFKTIVCLQQANRVIMREHVRNGIIASTTRKDTLLENIYLVTIYNS